MQQVIKVRNVHLVFRKDRFEGISIFRWGFEVLLVMLFQYQTLFYIDFVDLRFFS